MRDGPFSPTDFKIQTMFKFRWVDGSDLKGVKNSYAPKSMYVFVKIVMVQNSMILWQNLCSMLVVPLC